VAVQAYALLIPTPTVIQSGAGFYTDHGGDAVGKIISTMHRGSGRDRRTPPETGGNAWLALMLGNAKMKKAFWEPPKKPFSKMFIQRKVISTKQESCQRVGLIVGGVFTIEFS
jgi:hypothetical protein